MLGRFECKCGRIWTSHSAVEDQPQECRDCKENVLPSKVMFGWFECSCGRRWNSRNAVEGQPQKCKNCGEHVLPSKLEEVRMFGKFRCPECSHEWASASAWEGYMQGCEECEGETEAYELRPLRRKKHGGQKDKPHKIKRCRKCKELGYDCSKILRRVQGADT